MTSPIHTTHYTLRRLEQTDAEPLAALRSDAFVNRYIYRAKETTAEKMLLFVDDINGRIDRKEAYYWAITDSGSGELLGTICLFNHDKVKNEIEVGYELASAQFGKGIMTEVLGTIIEWVSEHIQPDVINAFVHVGNSRSQNLLLKHGFEDHGISINPPGYINFKKNKKIS